MRVGKSNLIAAIDLGCTIKCPTGDDSVIEVRRLQLDKTKRSLVISDIHANLPLFKRLLDKLNYTTEDYLFINGDLCEKGPASLEVVEYVRSLSKESDNVFITKGNCDVVFRYVFNEVEGIISYMNKQKNSVLNEMLSKYDKSLDDFSNLQELAHFYRQHFLMNWSGLKHYRLHLKRMILLSFMQALKILKIGS